MAGLMERFFGGSSSGSKKGGLRLMDRFMNPMTQSGVALLSGEDPAKGAALGAAYQDRQMMRAYQKQLAGQITDPTERAMLMMSPNAYVASKLKSSNPWAMSDGTMYNKQTGEVKGGEGTRWTKKDMRKEYDYNRYTPESITRAEEALNPELLERGGPSFTKDEISIINDGRRTIDPVVKQVREGMVGVDAAMRLLQVGGGAADYGSVVSFVKAVDPGTAAKEGEVKAAQDAQGYMNTIATIAKQAEGNDGFLPKKQKEALWAALSALKDMYKDRYDNEIVPMSKKVAKRFGMPDDADLFVGVPVRFTDYNMPQFKKDPTAKSALSGLVDAASDFVNPGTGVSSIDDDDTFSNITRVK